MLKWAIKTVEYPLLDVKVSLIQSMRLERDVVIANWNFNNDNLRSINQFLFNFEQWNRSTFIADYEQAKPPKMLQKTGALDKRWKWY